MNIYLDIDGVLADFTGAALSMFGHPSDTKVAHEEITDFLGISKEEFWTLIDSKGSDYWANLEPFPWFNDLVKEVKKLDKDFCLLSSPSRNASCLKGKVRWIQKHFGPHFRNYILTPAHLKYRVCSGPSDVLIDDNTKNIFEWTNKRNGYGILFPMPWNTSVSIDNKVGYISASLF